MTETTARIRWEPTGRGAWTGHVGTRAEESWLFQIWNAASVGGKWQLDSTLPGQFHNTVSADPDELKAEAEVLLEEFTASIGAVFLADIEVARSPEIYAGTSAPGAGEKESHDG